MRWRVERIRVVGSVLAVLARALAAATRGVRVRSSFRGMAVIGRQGRRLYGGPAPYLPGPSRPAALPEYRLERSA
jgi:hypothetical protein